MPEGIQAGGSIKPKRIVRLNATAGNNKVTQAASATAAPFYGISGQGTRYTVAPASEAANMNYHAIAGENCKVFGIGEVAPLVAGAGGVTAGATITSDSDGCGIISTTDGHQIIGDAIQSANQGEPFECRINPRQRAS